MTGVEPIASAIAFLALFALLFAACVTDIRERVIPNRLVAAVAALWMVWRLALFVCACAGASSGSLAHVAAASVADMAGAFLFGSLLLAFTMLCERAFGKAMMGGGDVKLLAAVALFLGVRGVVVALFVSCLVSFAFAFAAARSKRGIPFAPCIMSGTLMALLVC